MFEEGKEKFAMLGIINCTYLLDVMAIVGIHVQIKTNSAPARVQNLCLMSEESPDVRQKKNQN